jgi:hypothetical protein
MPKRWQRREKRIKAAIEKSVLETAMQDPAFRENLARATPEDAQRILDEVLWGKGGK